MIRATLVSTSTHPPVKQGYHPLNVCFGSSFLYLTMFARLTCIEVTALDAPSTSSRKTTSKASSASRSRPRGSTQRTSSGSSSKRRKTPWNPESYRYAGKGSNRGYNNPGRGSSSSGYSNYRRSTSTSTNTKRKTSTKPSGPAIDLMPT